jgi:hypothetical protein
MLLTMKNNHYVLAIDFDGTLVKEHTFPEIGEPRIWLIDLLKGLRSQGHKLILWTCREDVYEGDNTVFKPRLYLTEAVEWCYRYGLEFDAVNKNLSEVEDPTIKTCRKVFADLYIDDKAAIFDDVSKTITFNEYINSINDLKRLI